MPSPSERPETEPTCIVCGAQPKTDVPLEIHQKGNRSFSLFLCSGCGIQWWHPPDPLDQEYYEKCVERESTAARRRHSVGTSAMGPNHRAFLDRNPVGGSRTLLDVGCGDGVFLAGALDAGYRVWGLDLDGPALETAKRRGLPNLFHGTVETFLEQSPPPFDIVTFFEVLEHQPEPPAFMEQVVDLLGPGGRVAGSVPNRSRIKVGLDQSGDRPPYHYTRWDPAAMRSFLHVAGMSPFEVTTVGSGYWVRTKVSEVLAIAKRLAVPASTGRKGIDLDVTPIEEALAASGAGGSRIRLFRAAKAVKEMAILPAVALEQAYESIRGARLYLYFEAETPGMQVSEVGTEGGRSV